MVRADRLPHKLGRRGGDMVRDPREYVLVFLPDDGLSYWNDSETGFPIPYPTKQAAMDDARSIIRDQKEDVKRGIRGADELDKIKDFAVVPMKDYIMRRMAWGWPHTIKFDDNWPDRYKAWWMQAKMESNNP